MIYLDTHAVIWLYSDTDKVFSEIAKEQMRNEDLFIAPMVRLEMQYLYEIGRLKTPPDVVLAYLNRAIGLKVFDADNTAIFDQAMKIEWTRDVFDRLIIAQAMADDVGIISKDRNILENYSKAIW